MCIDSATAPEDMQKPIKLWPCHGQGGNQVHYSSRHKKQIIVYIFVVPKNSGASRGCGLLDTCDMIVVSHRQSPPETPTFLPFHVVNSIMTTRTLLLYSYMSPCFPRDLTTTRITHNTRHIPHTNTTHPIPLLCPQTQCCTASWLRRI